MKYEKRVLQDRAEWVCFCNRKRSKKLEKTGVWRQCKGSSFVNRSACIFGRNMQVYEIWTKKKSKCAGENGGFVNRRKLWIMWITLWENRLFPPFSLFSVWISWKLHVFQFRHFFTNKHKFVHFVFLCRKREICISLIKNTNSPFQKICVTELFLLQ